MKRGPVRSWGYCAFGSVSLSSADAAYSDPSVTIGDRIQQKVLAVGIQDLFGLLGKYPGKHQAATGAYQPAELWCQAHQRAGKYVRQQQVCLGWRHRLGLVQIEPVILYAVAPCVVAGRLDRLGVDIGPYRVTGAEQEIHDLVFAWKVAKFVKSNAIVYARNRQTVGVGAGQMSRVNSARIAAIKAEHAGLEVRGAVMASDAFFPFRDGIDNAAAAGIRAVIQPGGSMRDAEVIAAADEAGIAMVFTGMRHFRH